MSLRLFWVFMLLCASSVLLQIWSDGTALPERIFPTFFVIGFASFLIWTPLVLYRFLAK